MTPLCAILIPTRGRVSGCLTTVGSFGVMSEGRKDWEILLRVDDDDPELQTYQRVMPSSFVRILTGPQGKGYNELSVMYTELAKATEAKWIMQFNDDATIKGPWLTELEKVPYPALAVCEWHGLGTSRYHNDEGGPFPILPNGFWEKAGHDRIGEPPDKWSVRIAKQLKYPTVFLKGVGFQHNHHDR